MADGVSGPDVGIVCGHDARLLDAATDRLFAEALRASPCKVMTRDAAGEHIELALPRGYVGPPEGTRCYINLEAAAPALRDWLRPTTAPLAVVDRVNAYVSAPGCGAPLHFDTRDVCIVQLFGSKTWELSRAPATAAPHRNLVAPTSGDGVDYDGERLAIPTDLAAHVLRPGDWLMVPRGVWHRTHTAAGSVSVTLAEPKDAATRQEAGR